MLRSALEEGECGKQNSKKASKEVILAGNGPQAVTMSCSKSGMISHSRFPLNTKRWTFVFLDQSLTSGCSLRVWGNNLVEEAVPIQQWRDR